MTSAHARDDVRIFLKECRSLAADGFDVSLVVADGKGSATIDGVRVIDVGPRSKHRIGRATVTARRVFSAALALRALVYHFHDPELMPWGVLLRILGRKVVYDAHEHVPHDILSKHYLPRWLTRPLAAVVGPCELFGAGLLSAVVAATPDILQRFRGNRPSEGVYNFPLAGELLQLTDWSQRQKQACYIGGISVDRGVREIARAAEQCRTRIIIAGPLWDGLTRQRATEFPGWQRVNYCGPIPRQKVADLMGASRVGIVTFLPTANHVNALPNKLFEYMSAGIPVVASDFPGWREIVHGTGSGLCVDPQDPSAIAAAIDRLTEDEEFGSRCGRNGMRAVATDFNWSSQARKLSRLYQRILR